MDPLSPLVRNFENNIGARRTPCPMNMTRSSREQGEDNKENGNKEHERSRG